MHALLLLVRVGRDEVVDLSNEETLLVDELFVFC
jgi:hypothetical protein